MRPILAAAAYLCILEGQAAAQNAIPILPDLGKTPGATNSAITQTILCNSAFSTKHFRTARKSDRKCVRARYGNPNYTFTYDHLVPLELGGADTCDNLWPQERAEARKKDQLENSLEAHVCVCHDVTLAQAQSMMIRDWRSAWAKYVTRKGMPMCAVNDRPTM